MELLKKGAEADIYREGNIVLKQRMAKKYRIPPLDEMLRKHRTRAEAKLLEKAGAVINVPRIMGRDEYSLQMEFLPAPRLKDVISEKNYRPICKKMGAQSAKLHNAHIIHGDLTTSNMLLGKETLYFIDFGLGFFSHSVESMAVDLRLLEESFFSTHPGLADKAMRLIIEEYLRSGGKKEVIDRLEKIRTRGRYVKR